MGAGCCPVRVLAGGLEPMGRRFVARPPEPGRYSTQPQRIVHYVEMKAGKDKDACGWSGAFKAVHASGQAYQTGRPETRLCALQVFWLTKYYAVTGGYAKRMQGPGGSSPWRVQGGARRGLGQRPSLSYLSPCWARSSALASLKSLWNCGLANRSVRKMPVSIWAAETSVGQCCPRIRRFRPYWTP